MPEEKKVGVFSLEERVQMIQQDISHMKTRIDFLAFVLKKFKDDGIKVKVIK